MTAYDILSDTDKRREYDIYGARGPHAQQQDTHFDYNAFFTPGGGSSGFEHRFNFNYDDIFEEFFGEDSFFSEHSHESHHAEAHNGACCHRYNIAIDIIHGQIGSVHFIMTSMHVLTLDSHVTRWHCLLLSIIPPFPLFILLCTYRMCVCVCVWWLVGNHHCKRVMGVAIKATALSEIVAHLYSMLLYPLTSLP